MRWLRRGFEALLALLILFEEWGWEPLKRTLAWLMRWPPLASIERCIARLPPYAALAAFATPALLLLPVKLAALWLIGQGQAALGLAVIVGAKLVGTALVARLFQLTQPALLTLPWFSRLVARWLPWKDAWVRRIRASWPWRAARIVSKRVLQRWQRLTRTASSRS